MARAVDKKHLVGSTRVTGVKIMGNRNRDLDAVFVVSAHCAGMVFFFPVVKRDCLIDAPFAALGESNLPATTHEFLVQSV